MDFNKAFGMVRELLERVEIGKIERKENDPRLTFGMGETAISFRGTDNVTSFTETLDYFWTCDQDIFDTITRKTMQEKLVGLIKNYSNGEEFTVDIVKKLFIDLRSIQIEKFEILYHVFGVEYFKANPLEIGPYTIYNISIHRKVLLEKYPHSDTILSMELDDKDINSNVIISVYENVRESGRANEKARVKLQQFEDTIRFMIGDQSKRYDVGIFNFNSYRRTSGIILSQENAGMSSKMSGTVDVIPLHQFPVNDPEYGHDKIWEILAKQNPSNLEKRLISAIEWAGKALRDEEPARALTQYMFGFEALLQFQQKGVLVSPSITYQISEFAAFIISDKLKSRLKIEKMVKELYSKRSAIAHGGSSNVNERELFEALYLIKMIVTILVKNEEFKDFNTIEQLSEWVKTKKYS